MVIVCIPAVQVQAETSVQTAPVLGRLFTLPSERNRLNALRQNQSISAITNNEAQGGAESAPQKLPEPVTLQGYVKRGDGADNTLWINGQVAQESSDLEGVEIGKLNRSGFSKKDANTEGVNIKIIANGQSAHLKAGQTYTPQENKIYEMQIVEKAKKLHLIKSGDVDNNRQPKN